jgi:hypothetical protein
MSKKKAKIAIVGGGIAGASIANYLAAFDLDVTLFEKQKSLVNGPPICHLHAGGNLYREISDAQCIQLLEESIELVRLYPCAVEFRPTLIATPLEDKSDPQVLFPRLKLLQKHYKSLVEKERKNRVLGNPKDYYKLYSKEEIVTLKNAKDSKKLFGFDIWMFRALSFIDIEKLKFPLVMVQEYGLNVFRLAASVTLLLESKKSVKILKGTEVKSIKKLTDSYSLVALQNNEEIEDSFDYVINAAGFKSGEIDDMLGFKRERYVEFKAAYVTHWRSGLKLPEMIFHGERGTPQGMAQFTPYHDGYFQLHGMTEDITLFKDGLVKSHLCCSAQPKLDAKYIKKIYNGWKKVDVESRAELAIKHMSRFIPSFKDAKVTLKPLFGAQQIPGNDASLRAAEVSFDGERYARCEIVKASSVLSMADAITKQLIDLGYISQELHGVRNFENSTLFLEEEVRDLAQKLCVEREYPRALAFRDNSTLII